MTRSPATHETLPALIDAYVDDPGPATLGPLRHLVRSTPGFDTDLAPSSTLGPLLRDGDAVAALAAGRAMAPGALLSPSYHLAMGEALRRLGDLEASGREKDLARAAVAGILSTGDGTRERPWTILRLSDEYDVLRARGSASIEQSLVSDSGRYLDRHETADGSAIYFDVTGMV